MFKLKFSLVVFGYLLLNNTSIHAHSHTYIVEQPTPVVVVEQPVVVQQVQAVGDNNGPLESPPAEIMEQMTASPGDSYVWQKGHWQWNGSWVWVKGIWIVRPSSGSVYVPGYWRLSTHHHRWEWVAPYWR